jgi:hypothetical protein
MNWKINTLEYTNDNDKGVVTAHWDCTLSEGEYSARRYGSCSFQPDATSDDYIPFEDLTEEIVLGWVEDVEASITAQIEEKKNPAILKGFPW